MGYLLPAPQEMLLVFHLGLEYFGGFVFQELGRSIEVTGGIDPGMIDDLRHSIHPTRQHLVVPELSPAHWFCQPPNYFVVDPDHGFDSPSQLTAGLAAEMIDHWEDPSQKVEVVVVLLAVKPALSASVHREHLDLDFHWILAAPCFDHPTLVVEVFRWVLRLRRLGVHVGSAGVKAGPLVPIHRLAEQCFRASSDLVELPMNFA